MIYIVFILIAILSTVVVNVFAAQKGAVELKKFNIYKPCEEEILPYRGKSLILLTIICFTVSLLMQISLYMNTSAINFAKLFGLYIIVFAAAVVDSKRRIIPNVLIVTGLIFRGGIYVYEAFSKADLKMIFINDLFGFAIGFVLLAIVSFVSKGALGFGDAKLFGVIGLLSGSFCTYSTLLVSLVISVMVSVVGIARKKIGRKDSFPFGPCIATGYIIAVFLTSY